MHRYIIIAAICLQALFAQAGNSIADALRQLQSRTLIIVTETPQKHITNSMDATGQAAYIRAIENYNRKLSDLAPKFWTFNSKIEFKTWDEVDQLIKNKADGYLLLYAGNYPNSGTSGIMIQRGLDFFSAIFSESEERNYDKYYTAYKLCQLEDFKKNKNLVARSISSLWPLKEDIIFVFQYTQSLLRQSIESDVSADITFVAKMHGGDYQTATLMLKKTMLSNTLTATEIQGAFPYKFEVTNHDTVLNAISEKQDIIYVEIVPAIVGTVEAYRLGYEHVLISAKQGNVVGYIPVNYGLLHASSGHARPQKFVSVEMLRKYRDKTPVKGRVVVEEPKE